MTLPPFRPRSATELVDAAVQLARRHFAPLITLSAIISIPSLVLGLAVLWLVPQPGTAAGNPFGTGAAAGVVMLLSLVSICWIFVGFGALVASAAAAYVDGRALDPLDALRRALRRAGALVAGHVIAALAVSAALFVGVMAFAMLAGVIGAGMALAGGATEGPAMAVIAGVAALIGIAATVVGGLFAFARFAPLTGSVMLEGLGPLAALRRSNELVRGHTRRVAGVVAIMWVLYVVAYASLWAVAALFIRTVELSGNVAGVLVIVVYPFVASLLTLVYYDLRIRREGYDLELMARALEREPLAPPSTPSEAPV